jgi:hypothetical protein
VATEAFRRLKPRDFPKEVVTLDFDAAPDGSAIAEGQVLNEVYLPMGVRLHGSFEDSAIAATKYRVKPCTGWSAGNRTPLYEGVTTIQFVVPGKDVPAGVHYVGFYAAYVEPNSLSLPAFNAEGQVIGEVQSKVRGDDFLGLHSKIPIARIEIKTDRKIDKDFVIDDLKFDAPKDLSDMPEP